MTSRAKLSIGILSAILLLGLVGYSYRQPIALGLIGWYIKQRQTVGPNEPVTWSTGSDARGRSPAERPPNIVLILADDLGWNDLTFGGGGVAGGSVPTPNIDAIAQQGVTFTNGYAANGTCAPSRAALMSGRYGTRFGFEFTPTPPGMMQLTSLGGRDRGRLRSAIPNPGARAVAYEDMGMPASEITLAELLSDRGYHTVHIGKWHLGLSNGMAPEAQGFKESLLMASGLYLPEDHPRVVNAKQSFDPIDRFLWAVLRYAVRFSGLESNEPRTFEPDRYLTDYFTDHAVAAIEANRDRPFFLYLAHWAPHTPLQATREDYDALAHIESHRERVYAAMIRNLDRGVGRVLETLRSNGLEDNTLVLFTSDNGAAGYIGLPEVNDPYRGWKITFFEGGIHVPFFARWPARIAPGTVLSAPVHHFDMYATAAAAAGARLPDDRIMDGVDLLTYVNGETPGVPHEALFWRSGASQAARVGDWKLITSDPPGRRWLFDLANDPTEQQDLAAARPDKLAELEAALAAFNAEQAKPAWPSQASFAVNIDKDLSQPDAEDDVYIYWSN